VMVELCEADVLIREVAQASQCIVYGEGAAFERVQQFSEFGFVDWGGPLVWSGVTRIVALRYTSGGGCGGLEGLEVGGRR
jgi:hypothetical protein